MLYSEIQCGLRNKTIQPATGPCQIKGCVSCGCGKFNCPKGRGKFVYDHCHKHGHVRGTVCTSCNGIMTGVDSMMNSGRMGATLAMRMWAPFSSYLQHWDKCPECTLVFGTEFTLGVVDEYQRARHSRCHRFSMISWKYRAKHMMKSSELKWWIHRRLHMYRWKIDRRRDHKGKPTGYIQRCRHPGIKHKSELEITSDD